jgi:outer membrane protein assembly factor BamD
MVHSNKLVRWVLVALAAAALLTGCGFRRKKYENPIGKDTDQPDKVLFDKAVKDIEKGRYEVARLTLNTLMNTYDTSEYMAKAKLAIADSWMREGGSHSLAQAEAEYKDFILFYPTMEESAEALEKVCDIHYRQMEKPDRDVNHSVRAEDECRNLLQQFPNSKFAPRVAQKLRNIQESLAEGEARVGEFYFKKNSFPSAANRLETVVNAYPLFSRADYALWLTGESYGKLGDRFKDRAVTAYQRLVRDYPLSQWVDEAKDKLKSMEKEIPEPDPTAVARMKYEQENHPKPGMMHPVKSMFSKGPDVHMAAKSGTPATTSLRPTIPVSVPSPEQLAEAERNRNAQTAAAAGATADVDVGVVQGGNQAIDKNPDARLAGAPKPADGSASTSNTTDTSTTTPATTTNNGKKSNKKEKTPKPKK